MKMPEDPIILLSAVNMKLRDLYSSLDELCLNEGLDRKTIESKLREIGYDYDADENAFV